MKRENEKKKIVHKKKLNCQNQKELTFNSLAIQEIDTTTILS